MRIVHVLSSFGFGGQERVAFDLAVGQAEAGHRPLAVSLESDAEGPLGQDFRARGIDVVHLPKGDGFDAGLAVKLGRLFRRERIEVVHTHNPQPLIYSGAAAKLTGAALVHTKHGENPERNKRRVVMRKAAARLADAFVAVSAPTARVARAEHECRTSRLRVIPNGIDVSRFGLDPDSRREVRRELGIGEEVWLVGTVGRLYPEKGHEFLLRSLEPLLGDGLQLIIVGDGPDAARLAERVGALKRPDAVHLLGIRRDVPRVLEALDAFVLSSVREGLPLVIPEAMAAGLPVVSTGVGGIPDVIDDGVTGHLVDYGDEVALRERIGALAADPAAARRMGQRGKEVAFASYSRERMVQDYLSLYQEVVK